jgi:hypothetical protein
MRSHLYPSPNALSSFNTMDLGLSLEMSQPSSPEPTPSVEWELWGEETTIELCEVQLGFDGASISTRIVPLYLVFCLSFMSGISTNPLPPIYHSSELQLNQLSFLCAPPSQVSISDSMKSPASTKNGKSPKRTVQTQGQERGQIYLAASFLDFGDCELFSSRKH